MFVRRELRFLGAGVSILEENFCNVSVHGYAAGPIGVPGIIIPSEVIYGTKEQLAPEDDTTPPLDSQGTKRVQGIVGALLYFAQAVDNKLLGGLL